jgi:hypothetical protein
MQDERFTRVVRAQASARVDGDSLTFAGYLLPGARVSGGGPARDFELLKAEVDGEEGSSVVKYIGPKGAGSYVIEQSWRRVDEAWRVVSMSRPEMAEAPSAWYKAMGLVKKIYTFGPNPGGRRRRG